MPSEMNHISPARQKEEWRNYYAAAWTFKLQYLQHLIVQGEDDPVRLIRLLKQMERKYFLGFDDERKVFGWKKINYDAPLPSGTDATYESSFKGEFINIPFYTEASYTNFILDFLQETGDIDCIVELGCGYGHNLFEIYFGGGPRKPYYGGELTLAGQALGTELTALNPELNFDFFSFDHIAPNLNWLPPNKKVFFMTVHSIEQVQKIDIEFFRCLTAAAPEVIGLHLEPFGFQIDPELGPATKKQAEVFKVYEWNQNFYAVLNQAQDEGLLTIDYVETELFFPADPVNATSVAIWHKNTKN
jgi:hypothetical protein